MPPKKVKNSTKKAKEQTNDGNEKSSGAKGKSTSETIQITITTEKSPPPEDDSKAPKKKAKASPRNGKISKKTESVASKPSKEKPSGNNKTETIKVLKRNNTVIQSENLTEDDSSTLNGSESEDVEELQAETKAQISARTNKKKKSPVKKTMKAPAQTKISKLGLSTRTAPSSKRMKLQKIFVTLNTPEVRGKTKALACGDNDAGQLGMENSETNHFKEITKTGEKIVECAAGGMHSLLLTEKGNVYSFGCNDDGSLGRKTENEEQCFKPGLVQLADHKVAKIAVGSLHSVAITTECRVFLWGSYRDNNGPFGISPDNDKHAEAPIELILPELIVDVACGADHTLLLGAEGNVYTLGCAEHGKLGRIRKSHCCRENRRARQVMLTANIVRVIRNRKQLRFDRVWAGRYSSFIRSMPDGAIYGFGLNNFHQLGTVQEAEKNDNFVFEPVRLEAFDPKKNWTFICGGEQHTLALDAEGTVYSMGRPLYGRLGFGGHPNAADPDVVILKVVPGLEKSINAITAGDHCSFALDKNGQLYCWGQGGNLLSQGTMKEDTDIFVPTICTSKVLKGKTVIHISAGCSHALSLILD